MWLHKCCKTSNFDHNFFLTCLCLNSLLINILIMINILINIKVVLQNNAFSIWPFFTFSFFNRSRCPGSITYMSLQNPPSTFILLFWVEVVVSFDTSFRRGTYNSSKLMTVRVQYGTTNFIAAFIDISTKRRVRNKGDAVTAMSKAIAFLPCP